MSTACPDSMTNSIQDLTSSSVLDAIEKKELQILESGTSFTIYEAGVKRYGEFTALVQSSDEPISLGAEMRPYMDTQRFWTYVRNNDVKIPDDSPQEIYVYNWIEKAQGKMIFDVGVPIRSQLRDKSLPKWLQLKTFEPMKYASLVYVGPFPHQEGSGWEEIRWEDRAKSKGCVYDERMYRELYHRFDYQNNQHVTEIQISVE